MASPASSRSTSTGRSTLTAPLTGGGMDGYGAPQPMTMTKTRNGDSARVSVQLWLNRLSGSEFAVSSCRNQDFAVFIYFQVSFY